MKEYPILFSSAMVQALLAGRKTQTRRVVKPQEKFPDKAFEVFDDFKHDLVGTLKRQFGIKFPYGDVGDVIWVRESAYYHNQEKQWYYKATDPLTDSLEYGYKWKPSIHMPRIACRLRLEITDIKIERLQDINTDAAIAEGVILDMSKKYFKHTHIFEELWNQINGDGSWEQNPWVWVISFQKLADNQ